MRILHTCDRYHPSVGGIQEVVRQVSEGLAALGHDVVVATSGDPGRTSKLRNGVRIREFQISGNLVEGFTGNTEEYQDFLREVDVDIMLNYSVQQWTTDLALAILDDLRYKKVLVPCGFSGIHIPKFGEYYQKMPSWLSKYDMCVYNSYDNPDLAFSRNLGLKKERIIPNGADEREFDQPPSLNIREELGIPRESAIILLVGSHTGMKGHVEAMEIFRRSRLENSTLLIIGNDYGRGCGKKCAVLGLINSYDPRMLVTKNRVIIEDIDRLRTVAAYFEADVFLFPSQYECSPLVLYECLASGTPFISTDVGNAREIAESTGAGMIMPSTVDDQKRAHPDIDRSAKILRELIMDKDKIDKMGKKGRKAWTEMYTWSKISHQFESMYQEIIDGR